MKSYIMSGEKGLIYFNAELPADRFGSIFYPELSNPHPLSRHESAQHWKVLEVRWELAPSVKKPDFLPCLGFGKIIRGMETLVSDRARDALFRFIGAECEFLPVKLANSPEGYSFIYVTRLLDCLDPKSSRFGRDIPGFPTPVSVPKFNEDRVSGYLFRIGSERFQFDYDFATEQFVELVKRLGLTGFKFRESLASAQFCVK